ncbi:MAG: tetratricopeptide repeat protein, partial [Fulvivirga sp.]|uniref:tetratricopeptide repeat protein n=1 Tax=Fulvivirga sp. TaxID=1931237 RepID=UPI0032EB618D
NDLVLVISNALIEVLGHTIGRSLVDSLRGVQLTIALDSLEKLLIAQRDETEDFIHALITQSDGIQLLITSQIDLSIFRDQKVVINLEGLNDAPSKAVLIDQINDQFDIVDEKLDWLVSFCGGHPLSLKITSSLLQFYKSVDLVIEQLQKHDALKQPMRKKHNKENALSVCLDAIYGNLSKSQKELLHIGKFYPAGVKLVHLKDEFDCLYDDVATLTQFFFIKTSIDELSIERFSIPIPLVKYLYDQAKVESKEGGVACQKEQLEKIMTEAAIIDIHYLETGKFGSTAQGIFRMESELPNILNAYRIARIMVSLCQEKKDNVGENEHWLIIAGLAAALGKFCFIRGFFEYGTTLSKAGIEANIALGYMRLASTQYMYLAQLQQRQYDHNAFEKTCGDLSDLAKATQDIQIEKDSFWMNGRLAHHKKKCKKAIDLFEKAKNILSNEFEQQSKRTSEDEIDPSILGNIALIDSEIAHAHYDLGNLTLAEEYYKKSIQIQLELKDDSNLMSCYHQLANCLTRSGSLQGLEYYFKAIEGFKRNGQYEYLANSISELGRFVLERPELANHDLLDEDALKNALNSLSYQFNEFLNRQERVNFDFINIDIIGKGILIMKLISFTKHSYLLFDWAEDFRGKVNPDSGSSYFTAFLNVAHMVGGVGYQYHLQSNESKEDMIKHILQGTLLLNGGPDLKSQTFIFYWLAAWMKHAKLNINATPEALLEAAWESFDK